MASYSVPSTYKLNKPILQALDASSATQVHELGYTVETDDGRQFRYVYFDSVGTVQTYKGSPAVYVDTTADYVVTADVSDTTTAQSASGAASAGATGGFAGLFTMNNADVNNCYLWIQTKGLADYAFVSTAVAAEDELICVSDDCLDVVSPYLSSALDTYCRVIGIAMTAAAAHGTDTGDPTAHSTASIILY